MAGGIMSEFFYNDIFRCKSWSGQDHSSTRPEGPSHISKNGHRVWCKDGWNDREGGPHVIWADGRKHFTDNKRQSNL